MFVLRIALINFSDESLSLHQVAEEISFFYAKYIDVLQQKYVNEVADAQEYTQFKFAMEHQILPKLKRSFYVRKRMAVPDDMTFTMVTCTENLYKVFERC